MAFATGSVYDNYWVSHHIPRSDFQYSWITASILQSNPYAARAQVFGHAPAEGVISSSADGWVPVYNFVSASEYGSYIRPSSGLRFFGATAQMLAGDSDRLWGPPVDFIGLNININEPLTSSQNHLGFSSDVPVGSNGNGTKNYFNKTYIDSVNSDADAHRAGGAVGLNSILLHRNGPYGYPSWKQIRTGDHPVARYQRRNNTLSVQELPTTIDALRAIKPMRSDVFTHYNEPPLISRFKPIEHSFFVDFDDGSNLRTETYRYTHGNRINLFSYERLNTRLGLSYSDGTMYDQFYDQYEMQDGRSNMNHLSYREVVYPKEINTFLSRTRKRESYVVDFWRASRADREQTDATNSQGKTIGSSSLFVLDARKDFSTTSQIGVTASSNAGDGAGELQNGYTIFHEGTSCTTAQLNDNTCLTINTTPDLNQHVEIVSGSESYRWFDYPSSGSGHASGSFSLSAWFKSPTTTPSTVGTLISKFDKGGAGSNRQQYRISVTTAGSVQAKLGQHASSPITDTTRNVLDNQWHHVAVGSDGSNYSLWLDGDFKGSAPCELDAANTDPVLIGARGSGHPGDVPDLFFTGSIKHVSFWNTYLTASTDSNSTGSSGLIYDLYNSGCPTDLTQYMSSSIFFDGSNDYLQVEDGAGSIALSSSARSYSMWIRCETQADAAYLYYADASEMIAVNTNGTVAVELGDVGAASISVSASSDTIDDNQWHHIVVTATDSGTKNGNMYIDGVKQNNGFGVGGNYASASTDVFFGSNAGSNAFKGYVDEISVWSKALGQAEVTALYNSGMPNLHVSGSDGTGGLSDLILFYRMGDDSRDVADSDQGTYVYDQTSNNIHATSSGFVAPDGIIKHAPEALDGWYRFDGVDQFDSAGTIKAYTYNENVRTISGLSAVTASYALLHSWSYDHPSYGMFTLGDVPCKPNFIPCSVGAVYARRIPEINTSTGKEIGYFAGDTLWEAGTQSGRTPFYDSYDDYREDFRGYAKDYSLIPEFRVSEHIKHYMLDSGRGENNFLDDGDYGFLNLTGSTVSSSSEETFYTKYSHTDFLKYFDEIEKDHEDLDADYTITLSCQGVKKLLPYKGFYPADRTVQLATLFSESYSEYVNPIDYAGNMVAPPFGTQPSWRTFTAPIFGPGVLYNSIKSGLAVDFPQMTSQYNITGSPNSTSGLDELGKFTSPRISSSFSYRVPFEALVEPEEYLTVPLVDMEPHPSASLNSTASWDGQGGGLYKLAMHNFLAETVGFFLEDGNISTISSAPEDSPDHYYFDSSKEYKMRVVLRNSQTSRRKDITDSIVSLPSTSPPILQLSGAAVTKPTITMYDRASAFGPPVSASHVYRGESFEPFTPPYYDGYSEVEITFQPSETRQYYLDEIVSQATKTYYRIGHQVANVNTAASASRMHITASINVDTISRRTDKQFIVRELANGRTYTSEVPDADNPAVWLIQPKWETPILDFSNVSATLPTFGSASISKGMWHQYGTEPGTNKGIYLEVQDLLPSEKINVNTTASLASAVGFPKTSMKLGRTSTGRRIKEAVVAVPFIEGADGPKFFNISREEINIAKSQLGMLSSNETTRAVTSPTETDRAISESTVSMVKSMSNYVFPPRMDFLTYDGVNNESSVEPFVMYIFEFEHVLGKQDLINIWQNVSPDIAKTFETKSASISHRILKEEFYACSDDRYPEKLKWMVFKVKQRASKNYFNKIRRSIWSDQFDTFFNDLGSVRGSKEEPPLYSYNWPYDYFSLVEMAKLEANINIEPGEVEEVRQTPQKNPIPPVKTSPMRGSVSTRMKQPPLSLDSNEILARTLARSPALPISLNNETTPRITARRLDILRGGRTY